ncbi:tetratricopeptide repeat protein [Sneathiella glossodoripedis]|uniref:tetratricopeptide repeat protein n=1 Tax=Sneathiella glossodoripedis TaxID=418853 RepID=UPI00046F4103|nr:tetratricopeptide repeat protein [Sneathiella glossodoripedis]
MTLLLAAQAAELNRDERATGIYYTKMTEKPETRLLGLRGLVNQAKRNNEYQKALELALQADQEKPGTDWVLKELFDLSLQLKDFDGALKYLERSGKGKAAKDPARLHLKAILEYERAIRRLDASDVQQAQALLQRAHDLDPDFVPATAKLISLSDDGRRREKLISAAWRQTPHPDVALAIKRLVPVESEADWYARAKKLFLSTNPDHRESLIELAKAALAAREWGDARKYLNALLESDPSVSVYRLLADLEEKANADAAAARNWIQKIPEAKADPEWHCDHCGRIQRKWTSRCGSCNSFDSFEWKSTDVDLEDQLIEAQVVKELTGN